MAYLILAVVSVTVSTYLWVNVSDKGSAAFVMAIAFVFVFGEIADQLRTIAKRLKK